MKYFVWILGLGAAVSLAADDSKVVERFQDYPSLTRVTREKLNLAKEMMSLCGDPKGVVGPHLSSAIHVYASPAAIEARKKGRDYPVGAKLVKEKFDSPQPETPALITVMEKVADTGAVTDWEFYMIRLSDRTLIREGQRQNCADCHGHFKNTGYVSKRTDNLLHQFHDQ
jgi:hypothetical protein